jgi:hypothetical protein
MPNFEKGRRYLLDIRPACEHDWTAALEQISPLPDEARFAIADSGRLFADGKSDVFGAFLNLHVEYFDADRHRLPAVRFNHRSFFPTYRDPNDWPGHRQNLFTCLGEYSEEAVEKLLKPVPEGFHLPVLPT